MHAHTVCVTTNTYVCLVMELNHSESDVFHYIQWSKGNLNNVHVVLFYLCYNCLTDTHVLVQFLDEGKSGIVPTKRIKRMENLKCGDECEVLWSNKKVYSGVVIHLGMNIGHVARYSRCIYNSNSKH